MKRLEQGNKGRKRGLDERSESDGLTALRLTRIVIPGDIFWHDGRSESPTIRTKVMRLAENKALVLAGTNPKVTSGIGPASANIMPTASSNDQTKNLTRRH